MTYLTTRSPIRNLFTLHNELRQAFDTEDRTAYWTPRVDVSETESGFEIRAELPGITEADVNISVIDNVLTLKGEKRQDAETEGKDYRRTERRYGTFERRFTLPKHTEIADIRARFRDGVLTLGIPKPEAAKPTEIPITVNA